VTFGELSASVLLVPLVALAAAGCGGSDAPEEAPPLSTVAAIPPAAPGAIGVIFEDPKPLGVASGRSPEPSPLVPPEEESPTPLPGTTPPPNPFGEPLPKPQPVEKEPKPGAPKKDGSGGAAGPLPKGVQL
jgi:hypothetical protein